MKRIPAKRWLTPALSVAAVLLLSGCPGLLEVIDEVVGDFTNTAPIADAGGDQIVVIGVDVGMNANGSSGPRR